MSLIKCPNCGNQVSDLATKCPKCGIEMEGKQKFCNKCGTQIDNEEKVCHNCGHSIETIDVMPKTFKSTESFTPRSVSNSIKACKIMKSITVIFLCIGIFFVCRGFYKKNSYSNPDSDSAYSYSTQYTNSYVGGDAYNYIINGTYFTGYVVLGMGSLIIATITGVTSLNLSLEKE